MTHFVFKMMNFVFTFALRLYVRSSGEFSVALTGLVLSQSPQPGKQGLRLGFDGPPVATLQPMVVPCENQRQDWPTLHSPVELAQLQPQPSVPLGMQPEGICEFQPLAPGELEPGRGWGQVFWYGNHLPPAQRGSALSTALLRRHKRAAAAAERISTSRRRA